MDADKTGLESEALVTWERFLPVPNWRHLLLGLALAALLLILAVALASIPYTP